MNSALDFTLTLCKYYMTRLGEAFTKTATNFAIPRRLIPAGANLLYLLGVVVFFAVLLYDGFKIHGTRNFAATVALVILFFVSML